MIDFQLLTFPFLYVFKSTTMQTEFSLQTTDGLNLSGFKLLPKGNCKAVIALIHGMGEHSLRYIHVAKFFLQLMVLQLWEFICVDMVNPMVNAVTPTITKH